MEALEWKSEHGNQIVQVFGMESPFKIPLNIRERERFVKTFKVLLINHVEYHSGAPFSSTRDSVFQQEILKRSCQMIHRSTLQGLQDI